MHQPEIVFILFKPAVPGNVGASARALKTMGFRELRLIDPCDHLSAEALMLAHGAHEILREARVFPGYDEATAGLDLVICTTAKQRSAKVDYISVKDLPGLIRAKGNTLKRIGILFGTEESGLPNELIRRSDLAMTIPLATAFPSLNLSQAVMITAYELSGIEAGAVETEDAGAGVQGWKELKDRVDLMLNESGIPEGSPLYHRIMERMARLGETDIHLLHSVTSRLLKYFPDKEE
ncbi:MAG: TrmH family RNA methyltransferase [Bacteroidota bacterium]